jgi:hypothetical protein
MPGGGVEKIGGAGNPPVSGASHSRGDSSNSSLSPRDQKIDVAGLPLWATVKGRRDGEVMILASGRPSA